MLKDLVVKNRSYRGYDESFGVSEDVLKELVDMARLTASGANLQPIKYRLVTEKADVNKLNELTRWGKMLPELTLPHPGQYPAAYILMTIDTQICKNPEAAGTDIGIAAQTVMLGAVEKGLGGCMIANFDKAEAAGALSLPERYKPVLALAIGKPSETVKLVDVGEDGSTKYYRDENDVHFVPKRKLEDVLI